MVLLSIPTIGYIAFRSPAIQRYAVNWFMRQLSETYNTTISVGGVNISFLNKVVLEEVLIEDQSKDTLLYVDEIALGIDSLKLEEKKVFLRDLGLRKAQINLLKDRQGTNFQFLIDAQRPRPEGTKNKWSVSFASIFLRDSKFRYKNLNDTSTVINGINFNDVDISKMNLTLVNLLNTDSATTFFIDNASLTEKSGFTIGDLRFGAKIDTVGFHLNNLTLVSSQSKVESNSLTISRKETISQPTDSLTGKPVKVPVTDQYEVEGRLKESVLSLADLAYLVPRIWGMDELVLFSGDIKGSLSNLKFKKLNFKIGKNTQFNADLDLQGLPDWNNTFIYCKFYDNTFSFNDIANVKLPDSSPYHYPRIPMELLKDLTLTYKGNFTGFPTDFVAYGTLGGDLGTLTTDIAIRPKGSGVIGFSGILDAKSFQAGRVLGYKPLGEVTLHTEVNGTRSKANKFNATIKGNIDSLYFNDYRIDSIYVDGRAREKSYEGQLTVNDENLRMKFSGKADLESSVPVFNFQSTVDKANLYILGLDKKFRDSEMTFALESNFTGKHIDDLNGQIDLTSFNFTRNAKDFDIKTLQLSTTNLADKNTITLRSDMADIDIVGKYRFREIDLTLRDYLLHYIPSAKLPYTQRVRTGENVFTFDINVKKPELIAHFFLPDLEPKSAIVMKGEINSEKQTLSFDGSTDELIYKKNLIKGLTLTSRNQGNQWLFRIGTQEALLGNAVLVENLALNNALSHDSINTSLTWNNTSQKTYSGKIDALGVFSEEQDGLRMADVTIQPSNIWVADSLWKIDQSQIHIDSTLIAVKNFKIHHNEEFFLINGNVTEDPDDKIRVEMGKINLSNLDLILDRKLGIEASLNGEIELSDPYQSLFLTSTINLDNFRYRGKNFGNVVMENLWNKEEKRLYTSLELTKEKKPSFLVTGYIEPTEDTINLSARFDNFQMETLSPFLTSFANLVGGSGNGVVKIEGLLSKPYFRGKVDVKDGLIGIDYTKVAYTFNNPVEFSGDSILFRNMTLYDRENNSARFDGYITHKLFNKLTYNLSMNTQNILGLNTKPSENTMFYGLAHCSGDVKITGAGQNVKLDMSLTSQPETQIYIPLESAITATDYDFIRFINPDTLSKKSEPIKRVISRDGFEMNLDIQATPDAKIQINFGSSIGDVIYGQGSGNLRLIYDKLDNFYIYGNYEIEKGDYLFTLQNVIGKKFKLEEGGTIAWDGDPYGANIDLNAVYKLKASVYDLLLDTYQGDNTRRIPVECKINLSKKLLNPNIKFDILFPTADERTKDQLQQFISTQDDVNRQILSLLVMGQFFTPEYLRGRQEVNSNPGNLVGATTSEMLSNQLSNWLSQISSRFDIGFNYKPGDQVNTNQMEVALSTQIFNDRVTINGNIGNNSSMLTNTTNPVVGEVEVFVKLNKSGKLQLKAYNRSNDDLIYDTSPYKQGLGLSFRENFDTWCELFKKYKLKQVKAAKREKKQN